MRTLLLLISALALAGCAAMDQPKLKSFVAQTVTIGMPFEMALVRMSVEGFLCEAQGGPSAMSCTRSEETLRHSTCTQRVDLRANNLKMLSSVEVQPVMCKGWY